MSTKEEQRLRLQKKIESVPEKLREHILKQFDRMLFESEHEFEAYLAETIEDMTEYGEAAADRIDTDIARWAGKAGSESNQANSTAKPEKKLTLGDITEADIKKWNEARTIKNS